MGRIESETRVRVHQCHVVQGLVHLDKYVFANIVATQEPFQFASCVVRVNHVARVVKPCHIHVLLGELDHECTQKVLVRMLLREVISCMVPKATWPILSIRIARSGSLGAGSYGQNHIGEATYGRCEPQRESILQGKVRRFDDLSALFKDDRFRAQGVTAA